MICLGVFYDTGFRQSLAKTVSNIHVPKAESTYVSAVEYLPISQIKDQLTTLLKIPS